jgi:hypothetical protein
MTSLVGPHLIYAQHFIFIADAMTFKEGSSEQSLWSEEDGLYYDAIQFGPGHSMQLPVRSLVGLIPLYATLVLEPNTINRFPGFKKRMQWFIDNRPEVSARNMANMKGEPPVIFTVQIFLIESLYSPRKGQSHSPGPCEQGSFSQNSGENAR